nr:hypothetical protein GCM10020092_027820 [Actinoplanes digitatis]
MAAADLTGFALDLALWGHPDGSGLRLPDAPPAGAMQAATGTLRALGATDAQGRITARGRALADAGLHPRLARALLDGAPVVGARRAAEVVALLDADRTADDLVAAWRRARSDDDGGWRAEVRRLTAAITRNPDPEAGPGGRGRLPDDLAAGLIIGLAYPERVARAREPGGSAYLMAGGTAAELGGGSGLAGTPWLAVADADRAPGARTARIRSAAPLDEASAREAAATLRETGDQIGWIDGDVVARRVDRLGAIVLSERRIDRPDPADVHAAVVDGLRREGLGLLTWSRAATELRERLAFAHAALGEPWLGRRRRRPARRPRRLAAARPGPPPRRPGADRHRHGAAPPAALVGGRAAGRGGAGAAAGAQRLEGAGRLRRPGGTGPGRQGAGDLRLAGGAPARRRPHPGPAAPALARRPPGRGDPGPGVLLVDRLSPGPCGAARALSPAPVAGGPDHRRTDPPRQPPLVLTGPPGPRAPVTARRRRPRSG